MHRIGQIMPVCQPSQLLHRVAGREAAGALIHLEQNQLNVLHPIGQVSNVVQNVSGDDVGGRPEPEPRHGTLHTNAKSAAASASSQVTPSTSPVCPPRRARASAPPP